MSVPATEGCPCVQLKLTETLVCDYVTYVCSLGVNTWAHNMELLKERGSETHCQNCKNAELRVNITERRGGQYSIALSCQTVTTTVITTKAENVVPPPKAAKQHARIAPAANSVKVMIHLPTVAMRMNFSPPLKEYIVMESKTKNHQRK